MTVNNRLQQYLQESGTTQTDLSNKIGISRQNVNTWFTKGANISDKMLIRIIQVVEDIDARWLITGVKQGYGIAMKGKTFTTMENYEVMLTKLMETSRELGSIENEKKVLLQEIEELKSRNDDLRKQITRLKKSE